MRQIYYRKDYILIVVDYLDDGPDDVVMEDVDGKNPMECDDRSTESQQDTPSNFICCITQAVMADPVTDREGNSYERDAILKWLKKRSESPLTRTPLFKKDLQDNGPLRDEINRFLAANPSSWDFV